MKSTSQDLERRLRKAMKPYCRRNTAIGLMLFLWDYLAFIACITMTVIVPIWWLQLLFATLAGFKIANLATLSHDAAHNCLTANKRLNSVLGILGFLPGLFNYRLWRYDHHDVHHSKTNGDHQDSYTPLSLEEFQRLPWYRRLLYRFYRAPNFVSFGVYYIFERWWQVKFFPRRDMPEEVRRTGWRHFVFLAIYVILFNALLVIGSTFTTVSAISAVVFGFVIPFYIFQTLFAFTVYIQHNHERVPWFRHSNEKRYSPEQAFVSVHLRLPGFFSSLVHNVYEHAAHHVHPGIPCYRLRQAQQQLNTLLGDRAVVEDFSLRRIIEIMRHCKLYDYDAHQWVDYHGHPTSVSVMDPQLSRNTAPPPARNSASGYALVIRE